MSTSGSYDFPSTVTRNDVIDFALRKTGAKRKGFSLTADEISDAAFAINMILAQWKERSDGAQSIKMWLRKRIRIFLQADKDQYDTSDATDHIVEEDDIRETTIASYISANLMTVNTTSATVGDMIGIVLDDGTMHWEATLVTSTTTIQFAGGVPSEPSVGNKVYIYTKRAQPPVNILTRMLVYQQGTETPMSMMDLDDYDQIYDKTVSGTPVQMYYERRRASGVWFLDVLPESDLEQIKMTVRYPIEDLDDAGDNFDLPSQWLRALGWMLCIDMAPEYGVEIDPAWSVILMDALAVAQNSDPETSDVFFEPERVD